MEPRDLVKRNTRSRGQICTAPEGRRVSSPCTSPGRSHLHLTSLSPPRRRNCAMLSTNFVGLNPADAHNDVDLERLSDFQVTKERTLFSPNSGNSESEAYPCSQYVIGEFVEPSCALGAGRTHVSTLSAVASFILAVRNICHYVMWDGVVLIGVMTAPGYSVNPSG